MDELSNMCRICLADDVGMRFIANTHLQKTYESLTLSPLQTKDGRPIRVCYICTAALQNCYRLKEKCLQSEELFTQVLSTGVLQPTLQKGCIRRLKMEHSVIQLSIGDKPQSDTEDKVDRTNVLEVVEHVTGEREYPEVLTDVKIEPLEQNDAHTDEDIQCSHLGYTVDVIKKETDDIEIDIANIKLEVEEDGQSIEVNEVCTSEPSQSAYNVPPKIAKVVLERVKLTDTLPVTGILKKENLQESENLNKTVITDKITVISDINETVDIIHTNKHIDIYKQTSESYICSINKDTSKPYIELHTPTHTGDKKHTGEKKFQCDLCNKCLVNKYKLTEHLKNHTVEKRFSCDVCHKKFKRNTNLGRHMYTHYGERPFPCKICNKRFIEKTTLTKHMIIHYADKQFSCNICKKRFKLKTYLKKHMYTHTREKQVSCDICKKQFRDKSNLAQHMFIHNVSKEFQCDDCDKCFVSKRNLMRHLNNKVVPCASPWGYPKAVRLDQHEIDPISVDQQD